MDDGFSLQTLYNFIDGMLCAAEETKKTLQKECEEARFALRPWPIETTVFRQLDKNICTCEEVRTLFLNSLVHTLIPNLLLMFIFSLIGNQLRGTRGRNRSRDRENPLTFSAAARETCGKSLQRTSKCSKARCPRNILVQIKPATEKFCVEIGVKRREGE